MGKIIEYKIGEDLMGIIETNLYEYYNGKVDFLGPEPKKDIVIETGLGGMFNVDMAIKEKATKAGFVVGAMDINKDSSFPFTSYTIPFLANVKFDISPELDQIKIGSKMLDGYVETSYTYRILDGEELVAELICIGKLPVFEHELVKLIRESNIHKKYEVLPHVLKKYIMNCLKNLE